MGTERDPDGHQKQTDAGCPALNHLPLRAAPPAEASLT